MSQSAVGELLRSRVVNAGLAWLLTAFVLLVALGSALAGDLLWAGFAASVAALAVLPPVALRSPRAMLPWEVLLLAVLPVLGRTFATVPTTGNLATYLSVAALALVVAVELDVFTPVEMNYAFAVLFVVVTTMAVAGVWAVTRWLADAWLGTQFFHHPALTEAQVERRLMWEFVASTAAGLFAGVVFETYFRRRTDPDLRLPPGVRE